MQQLQNILYYGIFIVVNSDHPDIFLSGPT